MPTDHVDSPFQSLRFAEGNLSKHIPFSSTALSDTRSVSDETYLKQERTLAASVKIQFSKSLFPQRSDNKINSSSIDQRMVSRNGYGSCHGRIGLFRILIFEDSKIAKGIPKIVLADFKIVLQHQDSGTR